MWIHIPQEHILLSDVLVIDALNNPAVGNATESSVIQLGQSLTPRHVHSPTKRVNLNPVGEKGEYVYIEGRVLTSSGEPIPGAVFETWEETDDKGEQRSIFAWLVSADGSKSGQPYAIRPTKATTTLSAPNLPARGRLRTCRRFVPVAYRALGDVGFIFLLFRFTSFLGLISCVGVLL
jgi:hypothetical protein